MVDSLGIVVLCSIVLVVLDWITGAATDVVGSSVGVPGALV